MSVLSIRKFPGDILPARRKKLKRDLNVKIVDSINRYMDFQNKTAYSQEIQFKKVLIDWVEGFNDDAAQLRYIKQRYNLP